MQNRIIDYPTLGEGLHDGIGLASAHGRIGAEAMQSYRMDYLTPWAKCVGAECTCTVYVDAVLPSWQSTCRACDGMCHSAYRQNACRTI